MLVAATEIKGEYCRHLNKLVYLGHRKFLPPEHSLHSDRSNFPHKTDPAKAPDLKTTAYINKANGKYASSSTTAEQKKIAKKTGCKGIYAFRSLSGHDRIRDTQVDPMHLFKNIGNHIIHLPNGTTYTTKVYLEERERG